MQINFLDLKTQYETIKEEIKNVLLAAVESGQYIMGPNVKVFEQEIASYLGVKHAIAVANGTDALVMTLDALRIGPGDEVITSPYTFFASAECISRVGAKPVFTDIDADTLNMNPEEIEKKITEKTKAIIPVHIFGQAADIERIMAIAEKYGLHVIEDACQAIGAEINGRKLGTIGKAGCFSFFPTKNLGAYGDGGLVVTNDDDLAEKIKLLRVHGSRVKYFHTIIGYNSRLDEIQAAILRVKLKHIDAWNEARRQKAKLYNELLQNTPVKTPGVKDEKSHVYHLYTILAPERDELKKYLEQKGIPTGIYYPLPLHLQEAYKNLGYKKGDLPVAEETCEKNLSLPLYPELPEKHIKYIADAIIEYYKKG
ncbi:DegT/DnrJ/EryC1/StrS family aminotransferase [Thermosediminibacter oceani]|uniref:DegT/DnrJ/EryC1/StrS aminotransferase n=1 Tax=Thermosediminibacter oceani (strain ATCC BAA-1034 / DSM 16646 / JW/IW-1228P) TaxID=555079 RepID=D9RYA8_THEOJ|nr:DegT/DnrJ/EryC1/StrS family aminotransferase [Thermosediminibacter oceani]ADL08332.1 DegT/DnrJ/EryC1/StrS aminotransferase [Thermosediminibacter oceani DSM 16646]